VDVPRQDLLSRSALSGDQDRDRAVLDLVRLLQEPPQAGVLRDEVMGERSPAELVLEETVLVLERLQLQVRVDDFQELAVVDGLYQVVGGAGLEGGDGAVDAPVPRDHDHDHVRLGALELHEQVHAALRGAKADVHQGHVDGMARGRAHGIVIPRRAVNGEPLAAKEALQPVPDPLLVVHDQDRRAPHRCSPCPSAPCAGRASAIRVPLPSRLCTVMVPSYLVTMP
jgi:hypothetical protein